MRTDAKPSATYPRRSRLNFHGLTRRRFVWIMIVWTCAMTCVSARQFTNGEVNRATNQPYEFAVDEAATNSIDFAAASTIDPAPTTETVGGGCANADTMCEARMIQSFKMMRRSVSKDGDDEIRVQWSSPLAAVADSSLYTVQQSQVSSTHASVFTEVYHGKDRMVDIKLPMPDQADEDSIHILRVRLIESDGCCSASWSTPLIIGAPFRFGAAGGGPIGPIANTTAGGGGPDAPRRVSAGDASRPLLTWIIVPCCVLGGVVLMLVAISCHKNMKEKRRIKAMKEAAIAAAAVGPLAAVIAAGAGADGGVPSSSLSPAAPSMMIVSPGVGSTSSKFQGTNPLSPPTIAIELCPLPDIVVHMRHPFAIRHSNTSDGRTASIAEGSHHEIQQQVIV